MPVSGDPTYKILDSVCRDYRSPDLLGSNFPQTVRVIKNKQAVLVGRDPCGLDRYRYEKRRSGGIARLPENLTIVFTSKEI